MLGVLSLPFGVLAPFAIWAGTRSLRRIRASDGELRGASRALAGLLGGVIGLTTLLTGIVYWLVAS